ncbi:hypothetical protein ACR9K7_08250 [Helicobacter pylori]
MRVVVFDVSGVLEAFDYRGVLIHKQEKQQATSEITEAKKTDHYQNIDFFEFE